MRVLVDTSVWVDFFNGQPSPEATTLAELLAGDDDLCTSGIIVAEVFQGMRKDKGRTEIAALFALMSFLEPSGIDVYFRAAALYRSLRQRGKTIRSTIDCLIAVIADQHGCHLLARDRDLSLILDSGLVKVGQVRLAQPRP